MDKSTPIEATPLRHLSPSFADHDNNQTENISSPTSPVVTPLQPVDVDPSIGPSKRRRGRPKGSKNLKPSKKKLKPCHPNNQVVVAPSHYNDVTSLSPRPLEAIHPLAIVPYVGPNVKDSSVDDLDASSGPVKRGRGRPKGSKNSKTPMKKMRTYDAEDRTVISCPSFDVMITEEEKQNGNQELVDSVMMRFDAVRRRLSQVNCGKAVYVTAFSSFNHLGVRTNKKKRIGPVPGVQVGDIFYFWGEMCLVGLHTQMPAGIDYMTAKDDGTEGLATSAVSSGQYNDNTDEIETLIYTGQGGKDKDGKPKDQELVRGNLALDASKTKGNEVRVIRGVEYLEDGKKKKIYLYDGIYLVSDYWIQRAESGFHEFKFNLVRKPDQPPGYATWKLAEALRKGGLSNDTRKGFILQDLSYGKEKLSVPVVNEIEEHNKEGPRDFIYIAASSTSSSMVVVENHASAGCNHCHQGQLCEDLTCLCIHKNGNALPYENRILICRKRMIYECGDKCVCPLDCKNRLTQTGLKIRVEVFKTERCGWGLRSWEPIRAGTFICEFVGTAKSRDEIEEDDEYVFDSSRVYKTFRWNYEPELVGEDCWDQVSEVYKLRSEILVSARTSGNVSRFMNHSCSPNVMWQPVEFEKDGQPLVRIAFFAMKHIPPMTELRYDYGMSCDTGEFDDNGSRIFKGKRVCLCGSAKCCGSFE